MRLLSERCGVQSHKTHTIQVSLYGGDEPSQSCSLQTGLLSEIKSLYIYDLSEEGTSFHLKLMLTPSLRVFNRPNFGGKQNQHRQGEIRETKERKIRSYSSSLRPPVL